MRTIKENPAHRPPVGGADPRKCEHKRIRHESKRDVHCALCKVRMEMHKGDWRPRR